MSGKLELIGVATPTHQPGSRIIHPAMLRTRSRVCRAMIALHALAPEQAVAFDPDPHDAAEFTRLVQACVVRETIPGNYWLDLVANHLREQRAASVRAIWAIGIALMIATVTVAFFWL